LLHKKAIAAPFFCLFDRDRGSNVSAMTVLPRRSPYLGEIAKIHSSESGTLGFRLRAVDEGFRPNELDSSRQ
jgi:hypothetical protein